MPYGKNDKIIQEIPQTPPPPNTESTKPWIGNPLSAFFPNSAPVKKIRGQLLKGGEETANLAEQGHPMQSYLHSLGTLTGAMGGSLLAPFAATSPRLADITSKGLAYAMTPRQPGEESRIPNSVYGAPIGGQTVFPSGKSVPEWTKEHPTATRITGDVLNIASVIPAVKGLNVAENQIGKALVASAIKKNVPKLISDDISALHQSMPTKFKKDLGTQDIIKQKKAIEDIVIEHGLDKYIRNKDQFQSKTLDLASKASDRAENEALNAFYPTKATAKGGFFPEGSMMVSPAKKINPWKIAEDAVNAEKEKKSLGLFTGIKKQQLERAFKTLQKDWSPEWNEPKNIDELIQFKREVLNKDKELFKKESDISPAERGEIQVKKIIYHNLNDKLSEISPEYKEWNKKAKDLFNLSEAAIKYSPVEKKSMSSIVAPIIGTSMGAGIGYGIGKGTGSAVGGTLGALLGERVGNFLPGVSRSPTSLKEFIGQNLQTKFIGPKISGNRYQQAVSDVTKLSGPPKMAIKISKRTQEPRILIPVKNFKEVPPENREFWRRPQKGESEFYGPFENRVPPVQKPKKGGKK
jgi:hypothetical protein